MDGGPLVLRVHHRADLADGAQPGGSGPRQPQGRRHEALWTLVDAGERVAWEFVQHGGELAEGMDLYPIEP